MPKQRQMQKGKPTAKLVGAHKIYEWAPRNVPKSRDVFTKLIKETDSNPAAVLQIG
jgi:hypothetical protein